MDLLQKINIQANSTKIMEILKKCSFALNTLALEDFIFETKVKITNQIDTKSFKEPKTKKCIYCEELVEE